MTTPTSKSLQRAAQAWCAATTSHKGMDAALATEFARILDADLAAREAELARYKAHEGDEIVRELGRLRDDLAFNDMPRSAATVEDARARIVSDAAKLAAKDAELAAMKAAHDEQLRSAKDRELVYARSLAAMRERAEAAEELERMGAIAAKGEA